MALSSEPSAVTRWRKAAARRPGSGPLPGEDQAAAELPAELLKRLEFKLMRRLDGYLFGDYSGLFYGPSLDLAEVREYQPGDEVRRIDWNVTARTGTVHVRQYREEREINAWLVVDLSPSMSFGTRRVVKRQRALEFAAVATLVIGRRGNRVGALSLQPAGARVTPPGSGRVQARRVLEDLLAHGHAHPPSTPPGGELNALLEHANRAWRRPALVFVISDFLDPDDTATTGAEPSWIAGVRRLAARHELIAVRVLDPAERVLPRAGELRLRDPETGRELWIDTDDPRVRRAHARLVGEREERFRQAMKTARADVLELSTHEDIVRPVLAFTRWRRGRRA